MVRLRQGDHTFQAHLDYKISSHPAVATKQGAVSNSNVKKVGLIIHFGANTCLAHRYKNKNKTKPSP